MEKLTAVIEWPIMKIINFISWPWWAVAWLNRHKNIRIVVLALILGSAAIIYFLGLQAFATGVMLLGRLAFVVVFIVVQLVAMFAFLARGQQEEYYPGDKGNVTFEDDYFGNEQEVALIKHWTHLLTADRWKLDEMGAKTISGILMAGPPGVGKTLAAKCLATASGAAFFSLSATSLQAMFIGIGPLKVIRLVSKARKAAMEHGAAIIFFDEIDAIGGSRGAVETGRGLGYDGFDIDHLEPKEMRHRDQIKEEILSRVGAAALGTVLGILPGFLMFGPAGLGIGAFMGMMMGAGMGGGGLGVLSTLLTEMDGIVKTPMRIEIINKMRGWLGLPKIDPGVILFMSATNRPAILDPALVRPGRFDRTIRIGLPDAASRKALFEGYLKKIKHDGEMDIKTMVEVTAGVSHAFIASSIEKDAPRLALFNERNSVSQRDILQAIEERVVGLPNPIQNYDPEQKKAVAVHEAGHAIVAWLERPERRIANVSIVRRGSGILGYVRDVEKKEIYGWPLRRLRAHVMVSLAGHIAADIVMGEPWSGASSDFQHVRGYMRAMAALGEWGIPLEEGDPLQLTYIKEQADKWLQRAILKTYDILHKHRAELDAVVSALLEKDELQADEFYEIVEGIKDNE